MWTHTFLEETIIFQARFVRAANKYLEGSPGPVESAAIQQAKWVGKLSTACLQYTSCQWVAAGTYNFSPRPAGLIFFPLCRAGNRYLLLFLVYLLTL